MKNTVPKKDHAMFENEPGKPEEPTKRMSPADKEIWLATLEKDRQMYGAK